MGTPAFGAVFDWDGVICDSAELHRMSWVLLAREIDMPYTDAQFEASFGMRSAQVIPEIFHWTDDPALIATWDARKEELYRELLRSSGIEPLPGVLVFLQRLKDAGIPCVVGSSTARANVECALDVLSLRDYFQDYVCGEDVQVGKPNPEVFLTGADRISVDPARCVVFEDALVGIAAAKAGGMRVVGVASTNPANLLGDADRVVHRLDELSIDDLAALFPA